MAVEDETSDAATADSAAVVMDDVGVGMLGDDFHRLGLFEQTFRQKIEDVMLLEDFVHAKAWVFNVGVGWERVLGLGKFQTVRRPFRKEIIVGDRGESRCNLQKCDVAFPLTQLAKVGIVNCIERCEACVSKLASFVVKFFLDEVEVLPRCDLEHHGDVGSATMS